MNPDVFITIAFVGIAFLVLLAFLVTVLPQARREAAGVRQRESSRPSRRQASAATRRTTGTRESDAAVH